MCGDQENFNHPCMDLTEDKYYHGLIGGKYESLSRNCGCIQRRWCGIGPGPRQIHKQEKVPPIFIWVTVDVTVRKCGTGYG